MEIYLIHGDDTYSSYKRFKQYIRLYKNYGWQVVTLDKDNGDFSKLFSSNSLFGEKFLFVVKNIKLICDNLKIIDKFKEKIDTRILIYSDSIVNESIIKKIPCLKKKEIFKLSREVWSFVDNFYKGNQKKLIFLLDKASKTDKIEMIFGALVSRIKDLYIYLLNPAYANLPYWKLNKIKFQASKFNILLIKKIIKDLSAIDIKSKTSSIDLKNELETYILTSLQ